MVSSPGARDVESDSRSFFNDREFRELGYVKGAVAEINGFLAREGDRLGTALQEATELRQRHHLVLLQ